MADVLWVLICIANQTGVNLTEALKKILKRKTQETTTGIKTMKNLNRDIVFTYL